MQYIHKNFVRTNNRVIFKNLDIKLEKKYWGDNLEILRNNEVVTSYENVMKELNLAKGKIDTFTHPIEHLKQLSNEVTQESMASNSSEEQKRANENLMMMIAIINYNENNPPQTCKVEVDDDET